MEEPLDKFTLYYWTGLNQYRYVIYFSESVSVSKQGFPWSRNRYQNRPDMDKVSLSESEPKKLESPAPDMRSLYYTNFCF